MKNNFYLLCRILKIFCLMLMLVACKETKKEEVLPRPVRVVKVNFHEASTLSRYSGEVQARYEVPLSFQVLGKISQRLVDVGAVVQNGQLLATLDPADYRLGKASAAAQLEAAKAQLSQIRKDLKHMGNLMELDLSSPASYERRQDQVRAAEAQVAQAKAAMALSAKKSAYTELRAEQNGVITSVEGEVGQVIPAGQSIFRMARTEEMEVIINVPENRLLDLRAANDIKVSLWANPNIFYAAQIREISPGVDALIRTYTVKVSILNADANVSMGMTATVYAQKSELRPVTWLPLTALTQDKEKSSIWIVDPISKTVQPRPVTVIQFEDENAKISEGVESGELVVTAGVHKLIPGQTVRILGDWKS